MNQQIATTERNPMNAIAMTSGPSGSSIAPQSLGDVVRFAEVMCRADIALPKHLRGNAGACMAVAMQALEWQMSPFAVASKSYEVGGRIAYEAQLIAAVVNTRSGIKGRLKYQFDGEGPTLTCRVTGMLDGEECEYISPPVGSITVKNSPLWKSDPQQQLGYFSARSWARRHCPEVILGVYDRDEVEQARNSENARDVTPSLSERLAQAKIEQHDAPGAQEGFDRSFVARETGNAPDGATIDQEPASALSPGDDAVGDGDQPPLGSVAELSAAADLKDGEGVQAPVDGTTAPSSSDLVLRNKMQECLDKFMEAATDQKLDAKGRQETVIFAKNIWKEELSERPDFVKACTDTANKVVKGAMVAEDARAELGRWLP